MGLRLVIAFLLSSTISMYGQNLFIPSLIDSLTQVDFAMLDHNNKIFKSDDTVFIYSKSRKFEKIVLCNAFKKDFRVEKTLTDSSLLKIKDFETVITLKVNDPSFTNFKVLLIIAGLDTYLVSVDKKGHYVAGLKFLVDHPGSYYLVNKQDQIYDCLFKGVKTAVDQTKTIRQVYWKGIQSGVTKKTQISVEREIAFKFDSNGHLTKLK